MKLNIPDAFCEHFFNTHKDSIPDGTEVFDTFTDSDGNEHFCFKETREAWALWCEQNK